MLHTNGCHSRVGGNPMELSVTKQLFYGFPPARTGSGENKCASLNNSLLLSSRNLGTLREHWRALGFLNVRDPGVLCCKHRWIPDIRQATSHFVRGAFLNSGMTKEGIVFKSSLWQVSLFLLFQLAFFMPFLSFPGHQCACAGMTSEENKIRYFHVRWVCF